MKIQPILDLTKKSRGDLFAYATIDGARTCLQAGDKIVRSGNRISLWRQDGRIYFKTQEGLHEEMKQRFGRSTFDELALHIASCLGLELGSDTEHTYNDQAYILVRP